ncbi:MAG: hypothetical protein JSU03_13770 [Bacteroidetes bacterium]|nr:hypothetical protein [Bacteroidota bacterium]MBS1758339.1 hypothetical protein [Bacteroidota bacterium]
MKKQQTSLIVVATLLVVIAALSRVILYPHNFSPIIGMALFAGAVIMDKKLAFVLPIAAMLLSDVLFEVFNIAPGFWGWGQIVGYGILALITVMAFTMKNRSVWNILGYSVASSLLFFFLSNSGYFFIENHTYHTYPQTASGYVACLEAGIPFLKSGVLADLTYSFVLFGSYFLLQKFAFNKKVTA